MLAASRPDASRIDLLRSNSSVLSGASGCSEMVDPSE